MKTWWNILICMWISVIHGEEHVNDGFVLTSSPLTATDGELFTLNCSFRNESIVNIGWWQNNKPNVVTQKDGNCSKQSLAYGQDIINRINVSCSTTAHSMSFRFNSTTDQGAAWQCGKQVSDYDIRPRSNNYTIGEFKLTSLPLTATDGEIITMICSFSNESEVTIGWLQNNKPKVVIQKTPNCMKRSLAYGQDIINRVNVSCSTKANSMTFRFNSTTDQGAAWQCGKQVSDIDIQPRSNNYTIDNQTSSPVMSTQTLSTTTRYTETKSDPNTVAPKKAFTDEHLYIVVGAVGGAVLLTVVVAGVVCIRRRRKAAMEDDLYEGSRDVQPMNAAENQEDDLMLSDGYASVDMPVTNTCTPREEVPSGDVNLENLYAKPDKSKHTEVQHAFTDEHLYIVVGAVGGAVLLTVVVAGVVCISRRKKAALGNDLYEGSHDVQPMNAAENREDDLMLSDGYASVDMPVTKTCTPREEVPSGDVNLENISPVYQNTTGSNTVGDDLYEGSRDVQPMNAAENQEDDLMLSDGYASVDMPVTNTCTPREEVPSGDDNLENVDAKPDRSRHTEVQDGEAHP
ncbi:uncharacterized protein [Haliotis cracherodii]|uniref:uncharacterized protein n=1 Tax=Haliotis cracherodii TaxID=6455 RepID=UPI0039EB1892